MRITLSSDRYSHDEQLVDVIKWLVANDPGGASLLFLAYPDAAHYGEEMTMSSIDTGNLGIDIEEPMWCTDWIEENTMVYWEDGEPWIDHDWKAQLQDQPSA